METIKFTYLPSEISTLARRGTPRITMMRSACLPIVDLLEDKVRANSLRGAPDTQRQGKRGKCGSGVGLGHVQCIHLHRRFSRHGFRSCGGEERSRGAPSAVECDPAARLESAVCATSAWKVTPPFSNTQVFTCLA